MIDPSRLASMALVALALIAVPGPSVLFIVSRGVALGRRAAVATAVGNEMGLCAQVLAVALGLGAIIERSLVVLTVLKAVGAAYLVFLGTRSIMRRREHVGTGTDGEARALAPVGRPIRDGFLVGVTNPKSLLLFAAVVPQFVDPARGHIPMQMVILGLVCVMIALASDSLWGLLAGSARGWLGRTPRRLEALNVTGGVVTIALGANLGLSTRRPS